MPDWAPHVRARLASLRLSPTRENEIVEEFSQHLDERYRELLVGGTHPTRRGAWRSRISRVGTFWRGRWHRCGRAHVTAPTTLGAPPGHVLSDLWRDLRYAGRVLRRHPVWTATATLSLAVGIGLNAAVFSVVDWVLLRPLPYPASHELVHILTAGRAPVTGPSGMTHDEFVSAAIEIVDCRRAPLRERRSIAR